MFHLRVIAASPALALALCLAPALAVAAAPEPLASGQAVRVILGLGLVLAVGCSARRDTIAAVDVPFEQSEWRYRGRAGQLIDSEHSAIYTTIREPDLVAWLPQTMETAFRYYNELIPSDKRPEGRMPIYLFAAREEFEDFNQRRFGADRAELLNRIRNGGFMEQVLTVVEYVNHDATFPLMTHEGFHQYLHYYSDSRVPAWLNEGLATLCEGQRWTSNGLSEFDKWLNPLRRNRLAEALLRDDLFPLSQLLRINAGHVVGGSSRKINTYYAQVWALLLFLQDGENEKYREPLARMLTVVGTGNLDDYARTAHATATGKRRYNLGRDAFGAFIDDDVAMIEQAYIRFMRTRILNEKPTDGEPSDG